MRTTRLMCFLALAACGRGGSAKPDASVSVDAPPTMIDAPTADAAPDAPPPMRAYRVWAIGDLITDGAPIAGGFDDLATLPFTPTNPTPARIPTTGQLSPASSQANAFDVRGNKVAFIADATVTGRYDLNVANADGTSLVVVVEGGVANVEIDALAFSPDGTKVAFTMDATIDNAYDLYVVPAMAAATPVKVSPDRPVGALTPADMDVFEVFTWSADSTYVAFSADLTEAGYDQAYLVDTSAATPAAIELLPRADIATQTGTRGVRGALLFDSSNNVYFRARTILNDARFQLFKATTAGVRTQMTLPQRGDNTPGDMGPFAISPDGTTMVMSVDAPTALAYNLYVMPLATPTPVAVTSLAGAGRANFLSPIWFSPDGTKVAVVANYLTANATTGAGGRNEPYVIHLDGSTMTPRRLVDASVSCTGCTSPAASSLVWADDTTIYVRGDLAVDNNTAVFEVSAATADQAPTLAIDVPTGGDVVQVLVQPL